MEAAVPGSAYSEWPHVYFLQSPAVNALLAAGAVVLIAFLVALALEAARPLRRGLAVLLAVIHAAYLVAYTRAYDMSLTVYPLLDLLRGPRGHVSAVLDFAQLALLYLAASIGLERLRRTHINPQAPGPAK